MVKNMKTEKTNEQSDNVAAIGIGAMIVFIALILVAAVAAAVIIQTAEKLQQNAQTTGQDTTDSMAARLFLINVIVGGGSQLDVTFELAPGSDDVPTADILWTIICENGDDEGSFPVANAGDTHQVGNAGVLQQRRSKLETPTSRALERTTATQQPTSSTPSCFRQAPEVKPSRF